MHEAAEPIVEEEEIVQIPIEQESKWKNALARDTKSEATKSMYRTYNRIFMEWARSKNVHRVSKETI